MSQETGLIVEAGNPSEECQAWADMLRKMYAVYTDIPESETGIHRLTRISPFDPQKRRHTSFARVSVNGNVNEQQVKIYVLHPYTIVRDLRTGAETEDVEGVLAGRVKI